MSNKGKSTREFYTGENVVVRERFKSNIKYGVSQKIVFKSKVTYISLEKVTPSSYWLQRLPFCEGIGRPGIKLN